MTTRITVASHKGGVSKTTTTLNLGYALSMLGKKVLLVDSDPQGGIGVACNLRFTTVKGLVTILKGEATFPEVRVFIDASENLAVIGTGIEAPEDISFFEEQAQSGRLRELLNTDLAEFDYVLFDAPVGVGLITRELLAASDSFIHVINCRASTIKSVARLLQLFVWIRKTIKPGLKLAGILVSMYDEKNGVEKRYLKLLRSRLPLSLFFKTMLPYDTLYDKASVKALPVAKMAGGKKLAALYEALAGEIIAGKSGGAKVDETLTDSILSDHELERDLAGGRNGADIVWVDRRSDQLKRILGDLCEKGLCHGALLADEMGFLLAEYNSPLGGETLATYSSVLGESLIKAGSILEMPDANNLVMDLNESDKLILHWCSILDERYYLITICPQEHEALGEIEQAANQIVEELSA
ncbi:MAG: ParA family protein [Proteobacteria bacterium]|nr:ParA family protein [Pseudomonadota bacterium]MBU1737124.1 ParA family protein [Pseudomonadota bacterium]